MLLPGRLDDMDTVVCPHIPSELNLLKCYCKLLWLCIAELMGLGQLRQGDCLKFEARLDYYVRLSQKKKWGRADARD